MSDGNIKKLGLIAGSGTMAVSLAAEAHSRGVDVVSIVLDKTMIDTLSPYSKPYHFGVGQLGRIIKSLKREGVRHVAFAGKVDKRLLYNRPRLDVRTILALVKLKDRKDDTLMLGIIAELKKDGISVIDQGLFLGNLFAKKGVITGKKPSRAQMRDIEFGFKIAKEMGHLDIGQTVVVKKMAVLAVEAIEGTDEAVKRGCGMCKKGGVVVKVEKPDQDPRFDLPTIGITTIRSMADQRGALLAVEAGKTLIMDKEEVIAAARDAGITIIAVEYGEI